MKIAALPPSPASRPPWPAAGDRGGGAGFAALLDGADNGDAGTAAFDELGIFGHHGATSFQSGAGTQAGMGDQIGRTLPPTGPEPAALGFTPLPNATVRPAPVPSEPASLTDGAPQPDRLPIEPQARNGVAATPAPASTTASDEAPAIVQRPEMPSRAARRRREVGQEASDLVLTIAEHDDGAVITMRADGAPSARAIEREVRLLAAEFGLPLTGLRMNGTELAYPARAMNSGGKDHGHRGD